MKKTKRLFKRLGLGLLSSVFLLIVWILIFGIPKPFAITAENVPRPIAKKGW